MAGNKLEFYEIFQIIINIILKMLNLASSLKYIFFKPELGKNKDLTMERHRFVFLSQQVLS